MATRRIDAELDKLYQLPLDAFTAARNALAKGAGADAAAVKQLAKPPLAAWAVNQVYWQQRDVYDALVRAATALRQTHKAILAGRGGDLRDASKAHEAAVDAALKSALGVLESNGHPATDATRQALATTLRALPSDDPPGRLSRTLQPGGFEMLAGLAISGVPRTRPGSTQVLNKPAVDAPAPATHQPKGPAPPRESARKSPAVERPDPKALARAREEAAKAQREVREAEHTVRREEFEAARAARDAEKADRQLKDAREALAAAQKDLETAEAAAEAAARTRSEAEARATAAEQTLQDARRRARHGAD